jgi:predicted metalloprotease with PDZ domain
MNNTLLTIGIYCLLSIASLKAHSNDTHKQVVLENITINYHFKDLKSLEKEAEINQLITQAFNSYTKMFHGLPRDASGSTYAEISLHIKQGKYLGGEADPKFIEITWNDEKLFGFSTWQTVLLHELFHLWSAESFRYQSGKEHWFNEGFTEYYTYKTAIQLGLISTDEALAIAAKVIGFYSSSKGLGSISMRDAGASNKTKFDNYFLVYHGGWVVALVIDNDIRQRTNGKKSLDDFMRWMYKNYHREQVLYNLEDLNKGLKEITNYDYIDFFNTYVNGKATIPISDYFPLSDAFWALEFNKTNRKKYNTLYKTLGINLKD